MNDQEFPTVARPRSLGGSDAAPACGVDVYGRNRISLWRELVGLEPRPNLDSRPIRRGVSLEDWIASEYARETGAKVRRRRRPIRSSRFPWMHASVDRRVARSRVILECKSVHPLAMRSEQWGDAGTDEVPIHYLLQCVHYNVVADAERTDLAAMFGDELRVYHIPRNPELEARVVELERDIWMHAAQGEPPEPMSAADVRTLYARDDGSSLLAGPELVDAAQRLANLRAEIDALDERASAIKDALVLALGECASLIADDGTPLVTFKAAKDSLATDWRAALETFIRGAETFDPPYSAVLADAARFAAWCTTFTKPGSRRFLLKVKPQQTGDTTDAR